MIRVFALSVLLAACSPWPEGAKLLRTCTASAVVYELPSGARFLELGNNARVPVAPTADLDAICEGYER